VSFEELGEGNYSWGVRAENSFSSSLYEFRNLIIDQTAPQRPNLSSPNQSAETAITVTFSWTRPDINGSAISDSLFVSTDSTFVDNHEFEAFTTGTTYSYTFDVNQGSTQKYYWRVLSIDAAGNKSIYSTIRRFTVKNEK
jgi:hypothetical protein